MHAALHARFMRSMWPKEHGAYVQLALPLATALAAGRFGVAPIALALAACFAFVAHEPAAILFGARGTRARREDGSRAWKWLAVCGGAALSLGLAGLAAARPARPFAVVACMAGALAALLLYERKERTRAGEMIVGAAIAAAAAPVAAAGGLGTWTVIACWAAWTAQFAVTTIAVNAIVWKRSAWPTLFLAGIVLCAAAFAGGHLALVAVAPTCVACGFIVVSSLSAKSLRAVGFTLAVTLALSGATLAIGARS